MRTVELPETIHDDLELLARAWGTSIDHVIERLLRHFRRDELATPARDDGPGGVPVHAIYEGVRIEGRFDPATQAITITDGPLVGRRFKSPSGAAVAVVRFLKPEIRGERNGWSFWVVSASGERLQKIRHDG